MADLKNLEITKMLTLSTAHVTEGTFNCIVYEDRLDRMGLPVYMKTTHEDVERYGVFIYLDMDNMNENSIPEDLMRLIDLAWENRCGILCLDSDGPIMEGLTVYEWEG